MVGFTLSGILFDNLFGIIFAVTMLSVVALLTRGRSNRTAVIIWSVIAGIAGFLVGRAFQQAWIPFDELYVSVFSALLLGGTIDWTSGFQVSALLVVTLMILGGIVMIINFVSLIGTDETGITGLAK